MPEAGLKELLEAGVHFGHQTRRWNPNMRRYIFGELDGIHIIDLVQTEELLEKARGFAGELATGGGTVLFVGTKKQARGAVEEWADRCKMPYVSQRWLGGLLTNYNTISARISRLHELTDWRDEGKLDLLPTKERMGMQAELAKLEFNLGGVRDMDRLPDAVFVTDLKTEEIAVREAVRLRIPIIGLVDTNCDPTQIDYVDPRQRRRDPLLRARDRHDRQRDRDRRQLLAPAGGKADRRGNGAPPQGGRRAQETRGGRESPRRRRGGRESRGRSRRPAQQAAATPTAPLPRTRRRSRPRPPRRRRPAPATPRPEEELEMSVSAADVKALRDRTGAAMMDCKAALAEADGDAERAVEILRVKGQASAAKREGRGTDEGVVSSYIHANDRVGAMVEVQCETDFVARNEDFKAFAYEVALHIAATAPQYVSSEEIPEEEREAERRVFEEKAREDGKPDNVVEKIVEGQLAKWAKEVALLDQSHVNADKHDSKSIEELRQEMAAKTGENIRIARFAYFRVGD